jgi:hypothetical protein
VTERVGPVLEVNEIGHAIVAAIREANPGVEVHDRGGYLRVLAPGRCVVRREAIERMLARPFVLPRDLELVMPAFKGVITIGDEEIEWR